MDAGGDDYFTKPFGVGELLARMRVAFRHASLLLERNGTLQKDIHIKGLHIDLEKRELRIDGRQIHLTPIEYKIIVFFGEFEKKNRE